MSREKPRILVVEDDLSILTGVSMNLRFEGYEVLQAQDGERGLEMAVADRPDLVSEAYNSGATTREQTRRSATSNAQSGVTGVTHRNDSPRSQPGKQKLTEEQIRLARQMGLSPEKAAGSIARFHKRREEGISKIGAVGNLLDEESL